MSLTRGLEEAARFAQTFSLMDGGGVLLFDRELSCQFWSPMLEKIFGVSAEDALGRPLSALMPSLGESPLPSAMRWALEGRVELLPSVTIESPGSSLPCTLELRLAPVRGTGKDILGGVMLVRDISESTRTRQELLETESRFRRMADTAPVLLWMSGTDSLCHFFNQTWLDFTGRSMEQEMGVGWAEGVHAEDLQRCLDTYANAFKKRQPLEMEYRLRRRDGEYRWILDRGTARYSPDGTFAGYIGSCIDITELKTGQVKLERAVQLRDEFLSIASHELKTPLTSLKLQTQMLAHIIHQKGTDDSERLEKTIDASVRQVSRLSNLVESLLDISRIENTGFTVQPTEFSLLELAKEVSERHNHQILVEGDNVIGSWDRFRIDQVIMNLVTNAVKYGLDRPVRVSVKLENGLARVDVADQGIGIEETAQKTIFGRFARAASAKEYAGLGLGLYISKQIIEAHGGKIEVRSKQGAGSTFTLRLPLARG